MQIFPDLIELLFEKFPRLQEAGLGRCDVLPHACFYRSHLFEEVHTVFCSLGGGSPHSVPRWLGAPRLEFPLDVFHRLDVCTVFFGVALQSSDPALDVVVVLLVVRPFQPHPCSSFCSRFSSGSIEPWILVGSG